MISELSLFHAIIENSSEGILITDQLGNILLVNGAFTAITGYEPDEVIGKNPRFLKSGRHDAKFYEQMWDSMLIVGQWQGEIENKRKDGTIFPENLRIITIRDDGGAVTNFIGIFKDLTTQKDTEDFFKFIATHDPLTNLPNRSRFYDYLNESVYEAKLFNQKMAILYIDLDGFKEINDTYGHQVGDQMLIAVADRFQGCLNESDIVCRMGGDEFTIIKKAITRPEEAAETAERVLASLSRPFNLDGIEVSITASIGICLYKGDIDHTESILIHADQAMYRAKEAGKNGYRFSDQ